METFLEPLVLKQKPRLAVQLVSSLLILFFAFAAYISLPSILAGYDYTHEGPKKKPRIGILIGLFLASLIPGIFIFNIIKNNLKFE